MITLLASITGFVGSLIPEIIKFLKDKNDKQHELEILAKQIEHSKTNKARNIEEISVSRDLIEQASLYSTYKSGVNWVDALNSSVRPVLAYCFFIMYASVKFIQYKALSNTTPLIGYIEVLWNMDDQAIFVGIISFYFGQRTFSKAWKNK